MVIEPADHSDLPEPPAAEQAPGEGAVRVPRRTFPIIAWLLIVGLCALAAVGQAIRKDVESDPGEDRLGVMLMRLQSQYFVFAADLQGSSGLLYDQARMALNVGSIDQRQRFVPVAGELGGAEEALAVLDELEQLIAEQRALGETPLELSEEQRRVGRLLREVYTARAGTGEPRLDDEQQQFLEDALGWFGRLAVTPPDGPPADRAAILAPGKSLLVLFVAALVVGGVGGLLGFAGLAVMLVLTVGRRVSGGLAASPVAHVVYAETFAVWLILFIGLQLAAAVIAGMVGADVVLAGIVAFFLSLLALAWPVIRGVPWSQVRRDIGLDLGRRPALEPLIGVGGYFMGLPILAIGIGFTFVLLLLQQLMAGDGPTFGPSGGPAHPVVEQLGGTDLWPKLRVLLLASVAAPIVEETMFRGVLYRHLRMATSGMPAALSVILSGLLGGFLFAVIHPQGWVAVPALMSLAFAFTLAREWRGTLVVPIVMHGLSNGLVLTLLMVALSISTE